MLVEHLEQAIIALPTWFWGCPSPVLAKGGTPALDILRAGLEYSPSWGCGTPWEMTWDQKPGQEPGTGVSHPSQEGPWTRPGKEPGTGTPPSPRKDMEPMTGKEPETRRGVHPRVDRRTPVKTVFFPSFGCRR